MGYSNKDKANLNWIDRFGLAYCRLNTWEWDDICGEKPEGFDELPDGDPKRGRLFHKPILCKSDFIDRLIPLILDIGKANSSRCWWLFELKKTEKEWMEWYFSHIVKEVNMDTRNFRRLKKTELSR